MTHTWKPGVLLTALLALALSGCGDASAEVGPQSVATSPSVSSAPSTSPPSVPSASPTVSPAAAPRTTRLICDPGGGFPKPKRGCPDPDPETGWLSGTQDGLRLKPLRTYTVDAEGKAYAEQQGLEFPFSNDYYDAPDGVAHRLELDPDTVCSGIIVVDVQDPLADHAVSCADLVRVAAGQRVTVAVWRDGDRVVQVSELYRP
jgi:hypothetical protein